jgi:hypothetical protein
MSEIISNKSNNVQAKNVDVRAHNLAGGALTVTNDLVQTSGSLVTVKANTISGGALSVTNESDQSSGDLVSITGLAGQSALNVSAGNVAIAGELTGFRKTVTVSSFNSANRINIGLTASGSIVTFPINAAAANIGLPKIGPTVKGWHVTLVAAADIKSDAAITIRQGAETDGTGTLADTPFFGILMDDGANSLAGTASAVMVAGKVKKGDHIEITCDGTNYIIRAQTVTAAGVTVGS